jgi:hypothetical protein
MTDKNLYLEQLNEIAKTNSIVNSSLAAHYNGMSFEEALSIAVIHLAKYNEKLTNTLINKTIKEEPLVWSDDINTNISVDVSRCYECGSKLTFVGCPNQNNNDHGE